MAGRAYFDTSVLMKRYRDEPGASPARGLLRRHRVVSSAIAMVELAAAVYRQHTEGTLDERVLLAVLARLRDDREQWDLIAVTPSVLAKAEDVVAAAPLRTLDAIHVASALWLQAETGVRYTFVTADVRQGQAARLLGLAVTQVG